MKEVCYDVKIEPELLSIEGDGSRTGNAAEKARLDVSGVGVWGAYEKTYLDIRITRFFYKKFVYKKVVLE